MNTELEALRAMFDKAKPSNTDGHVATWKKRFDFWKMNDGEVSVVRFLKDADANNPFKFFIENNFHKLTVNGKTKIVPCLKMYDKNKPCPCCILAQKYYAEKNDEMGSKYYKKREWLYAAKVMSTTVEIDSPTDTKYLALGPKIHAIITEALKSTDLDQVPYHLTEGYDFRIKKSPQGKWSSYDLSSFAPKQTALPEEIIADLEFLDLKTLRTAEISLDQMNMYLLADQTGQSVEDLHGTVDSVDEHTSTSVAIDSVPASYQQPAVQALPKEEAVVETPKAVAPDNSDRVKNLLDQIRANANKA